MLQPRLVRFCLLISLTTFLLAQESGVPAFHPAPPVKGERLPAVLTSAQLGKENITVTPAVDAAYQAAAKIPAVLYQLPCYCHCDRDHGHRSLHSCFENTHGANCGTCLAEALYAYQMSKKGWSAKMIRDGIIRGDWKMVDLQHPPLVR